MLVLVDRFHSDMDSTLSRITVDDRFVCFGLEDEYRASKVPAETRIPAGIYTVKLRREGGFHQKYNAKFHDIHRGMLQVMDVPGFEYILIHVGNTDADTAGCLLVGQVCCAMPGDLRIGSSVAAYRDLYPRLVHAAREGSLQICYQDNDQ